MLTTTEGVSFTWLVFWGVFLLINLSLAWRAHRVQASRLTRQAVLTYATWTAMMILDTAIFVWRDEGVWTAIDTATAAFAGAGIVITLLVAGRNGLGIADPIVRGCLAIQFKGVPQVMLAWNILQVGGGGVSIVGILTGHITIGSRLVQIVMLLREAGWDRNRQGALIGEAANELSWILATIAWFVARAAG